MCYSLGIYLLNLFLAFLQPKFDPSLTQDEGIEDGDASQPTLPTKQDEEFRPFIRRLPEFKFWHSSTRAIAIAFFCSWWGIFNVPVFWPVLVIYCKHPLGVPTLNHYIMSSERRSGAAAPRPCYPSWMSDSNKATTDIKISHNSLHVDDASTNTAHDQVPLRTVHVRQSKVQPAKRPLTDKIWKAHIYLLTCLNLTSSINHRDSSVWNMGVVM